MTNTPHLLLTVDYELFGNGQGCPRSCVIAPSDRMMMVAEQFDAPLTLFVEAVEFSVMQKANDVAFEGIIEQIADACSRGHDLQLHIHPQWSGVKKNAQGKWNVGSSNWRIGDLDRDEIQLQIVTAKDWLETTVRTFREDYICLAFRAGGWCIQPSKDVLRVLSEQGIKIDSTVAPGLFNSVPGEWSDFRTAPNKPWWRTTEDVCREELTGLYEMPIVTGKISATQHLQALYYSRQSGNGGFAPECSGSYKGPDGQISGIWEKLKKLRRLGNVMLDFSTMPSEVLIAVAKQWLKRHQSSSAPIPLVAIAHTKNFTPYSEEAMTGFLEWAKETGIVFSTYGKWLDALNE